MNTPVVSSAPSGARGRNPASPAASDSRYPLKYTKIPPESDCRFTNYWITDHKIGQTAQHPYSDAFQAATFRQIFRTFQQNRGYPRQKIPTFASTGRNKRRPAPNNHESTENRKPARSAAHRTGRHGRRHFALGPRLGRCRAGRHRRHLVGRTGSHLQRLFEGLPQGQHLGAEGGAAQGARADARHHRRQRHGGHVELRRHGPHGHCREGRHHLLGCGAAAQPPLVPHPGGADQAGPHRLVGTRRRTALPQVVLGVPLPARRDCGRGSQGGRPPGLQARTARRRTLRPRAARA